MSGAVPPDGRSPPIELLAQQLADLQRLANQSTETFHRSVHDDEARRWIAKTIIWIFVAVVAAVLILLLVQGIMTGNWTAATSQATDLIKSSVVPVVTLVLGYYFGRSGRS
jgi:hypothetical protein